MAWHYYGASATVTAETWKGLLDFDRACSGPDQRCWLCTELTPWNRAMHGLAFELVELRPGKLRLQSMPHGDADFKRGRPTATAEASFLLSWLLQHHPCIEELNVAYNLHPSNDGKHTPFPIRLRPASGSDSRRTIRYLELEGCIDDRLSTVLGAQHSSFGLEDLDAVGGLESVRLSYKQISPKLAALLAKLLRRNAGSIKSFEIFNDEGPRHVNEALRYLFNCESLRLLAYHCGGRPSSMNSVARLLHSSTALKELTIAQIASTEQMSLIAKELEANTTLTLLNVHVGGAICSPEPVFTALCANATLKELQVTDCHIRGECGRALALLLLKNTGLRHLYIGDVEMSESSMFLLADALALNTTLESLHFSSEMLPEYGVAALCKALRTNKTLKKLIFTDFEWVEDFSTEPVSRQISKGDLYDRVQLTWTEPDLPGLTAALNLSSAGLERLYLLHFPNLSVGRLKLLFNALASNTSVRTLGVRIEEDPREKGRALCKALRSNRTIQFLDLYVDCDEYKFVGEVFRALEENAGITKMHLGIGSVRRFETATALSHLLAHNTTATKCFLTFFDKLYPKFVQEISQGMLQNRTIVKFGLRHNLPCDEASFPLFEAVRRNRGALNRAVDFVVSPSIDRQCAEGFERFSGRPYFLKQLKKGAGKTESEALLGIAAAERYLRANFLLITGIVQHSVQCHPAECTQVDALNSDCWLAIVRHLKLADVVA
ncbi:hypothetical protein HPB48_023397 [Haemaphysalis longicornis]|uniref:Ran GTPase-activating protein n=1 Tax=Haemaphysalis longicornis TaxID=44386 RepID=A0A9J6H590_HAELO|nr:hypothetical protein HPB48_023397 [Haemaphysalis longicornis]